MTTRREKLEARLQEDPHDVFLNYSYAMELAKTGDVPAAGQAFETVLALDSRYVPAYFQQGQMLAGAGLIAEARAILQRGIQVARAVRDDHALGEMTEFLDGLPG